MYQEYKRGPAVKFGPGGDYTENWPADDDNAGVDLDDGVYQLQEEDEVTPAAHIRATITPAVDWQRVMMVGMCGSYFIFGVFVGWWIM